MNFFTRKWQAMCLLYKLDWTIKRLDQMPITLSNMLSQEPGWLRIVSELPTENVRIVNTH